VGQGDAGNEIAAWAGLIIQSYLLPLSSLVMLWHLIGFFPLLRFELRFENHSAKMMSCSWKILGLC